MAVPHRIVQAGVVLLLAGLALGCNTPQDKEVYKYSYSTYSILSEMRKDLAPRVDQLNETCVDLQARVESSETEMRKLNAVAEENQMKLDELQSQLTQMADVLFRYLNVTPPSGFDSRSPGPSVDVGRVNITPPATLDGPSTQLPGTQPGTLPGAGTVAPGAVAAPDRLSNTAVSDFNEALKKLDEQDYEQAAQLFDAFLQRYPNNDYTHRAQFWKGHCYYQLQRYQDAITEFEKLRANFRSSDKGPSSMYYQAMAHVKLGEKDKAILLLEDLAQKYPTAPITDRAKSAIESLRAG